MDDAYEFMSGTIDSGQVMLLRCASQAWANLSSSLSLERPQDSWIHHLPLWLSNMAIEILEIREALKEMFGGWDVFFQCVNMSKVFSTWGAPFRAL